MKIVLVVEYEGTRYRGFQRQATPDTIQGELERAVEKLTGVKVGLVAASRTDSGVHARAQVVSFRTNARFSAQTWVRALNFYLPQDIAVKSSCETSDDFRVRSRAVSREYQYYIWNDAIRSPLERRFAHFVPQRLDIKAMNQACQALLGKQDFAPFAPPLGNWRSTVRTVYQAEVFRKDELVVFRMVADSFLPHQVRNTVGGLIRVGLGQSRVETFWGLARSKKPAVVGPAAPAQGLCLVKVNYPDFPAVLQEQEDENL